MEAIDVLHLYKEAQKLEKNAWEIYRNLEKSDPCGKCDYCMEGPMSLYCFLGADYHFEECVNLDRVNALTKKKSLEDESDRLMKLFNKELLLID